MKQGPLTSKQVAQYCHVSNRAVLKWIEEGKLKAYRTPGNHSRVSVEDLVAFLKQFSMPIPRDLDESQRNRRILIVDDDPKIVDLLKVTLSVSRKFDIKTANDGFSAGQKFAGFKPDLVILDINMPVLDGYEVCAQILGNPENKKVQIMIISGELTDEARERLQKLGANAFMAKPFDLEKVKKKVNKLLGIEVQQDKETG